MKPLSRRAVLRGAGGFALGLPLLEAMMGRQAWAQAAPPKRYLLGFAGCSLGGYNGSISQTFVPSTVGANYDLKAALQNLAPVKSSVSVITGLKLPWASGGVLPAGGRPTAFHGNQVAPLLTGMRGGDFTAPTTEHLAGDLLGGNTTFKTLVTRVQVSSYVDSAQPGTGQEISFRRGTSGGVQSVPPRYSPQQLFQALFGNFSSTGLTPDQVAEQRWQLDQRKSVLDAVGARMARLKTRLGVADQKRLDAHLAEFRELEVRVAAIPPPMVGTCLKPANPGADPAIGGNQATSNGNITYMQNLGYSGEDARAKVMCDLIHMAIACDLTRSVLFQFTNSQSFLNMSTVTGQRSDLHELSHGGFGNLTDPDTTQALAKGINWHMKHWAYLLGKLKATPEGSGNILDNMAAVFTFEGGQGFDPADPNQAASAHSTENMAMLVAGGAGGLKQGQHLRATGLHPAQVLLTALRAIGYAGNALGEISGEIPGLR